MLKYSSYNTVYSKMNLSYLKCLEMYAESKLELKTGI